MVWHVMQGELAPWYALTHLLCPIHQAIMFSCFIVFDIQAVVGGKHRKYQLGPDDYVFAALNLYLDIVSLFVVMLLFCVGKDGQTA